jgi:Na+-translocating ferredoxin:NAD+ oxidoreductase RnfA subunit
MELMIEFILGSVAVVLFLELLDKLTPKLYKRNRLLLPAVAAAGVLLGAIINLPAMVTTFMTVLLYARGWIAAKDGWGE